MPIKQKKSSRDGGHPKDRPEWDDKGGAVPGESADARIRRMSMQMASAERSGFRGERTDLYGGLPLVAVWAIRIVAVALVVGGIFAATSLFKSEKPVAENTSNSDEDAIEALIRAAREKPEEPVSTTPENDSGDEYLWLPVTDASFSQYRETILAFLASSTTEERIPFVIPTPDTEDRLENFANHALFDQISTPEFAANFCTGDGWVTVDALLPAFGFRPFIIKTSEEKNQIDLDAFLGYNPKTAPEIRDDLKNGQQVTFRTLASLSSRTAETPGDLLVILREPNDTLSLNEPIIARLSKFGVAPEYIIAWVAKGRPLPFTVTVMDETSLTGDSALRVSDIKADAWSSGITPSPVVLAPPSTAEKNGSE